MTSAITIGIRVLEVLFFAGWIGSVLVILLSLFDYIRTYISPDEAVSQPPAVAQEPGQPQAM